MVLYEGLTEISDYAFGYCSSMTSLTIPSSVKNIGYEAFYACSSLTTLTIPDGVETIENHAFSENESLTKLVLPNSITSIGISAFSCCNNLTTVYTYIPTPFAISAFPSAINNCTLYVPEGSIDAYKNTSGWNSFGNYFEIE